MAEEKKLKVASKATNEVEQPSYEELKNYCDQLMMQRNQLGQKLQQITNILNKLPWLFEVLKVKEMFSESFVKKCADEIENIMTPPEDTDKETNKD